MQASAVFMLYTPRMWSVGTPLAPCLHKCEIVVGLPRTDSRCWTLLLMHCSTSLTSVTIVASWPTVRQPPAGDFHTACESSAKPARAAHASSPVVNDAIGELQHRIWQRGVVGMLHASIGSACRSVLSCRAQLEGLNKQVGRCNGRHSCADWQHCRSNGRTLVPARVMRRCIGGAHGAGEPLHQLARYP